MKPEPERGRLRAVAAVELGDAEFDLPDRDDGQVEPRRIGPVRPGLDRQIDPVSCNGIMLTTDPAGIAAKDDADASA